MDDELTTKPGDVITVDDWDISDDWARGTLNGKIGLFYKTFTKPSSEVPSPDDFKLEEVRGKPKGYTTTYQGREYILKEKLDEVECIICLSLADNAHQTSCCGSTICLGCANTWKKQNNSCPQCRKALLEIVVDPRTQRRITGATVYCPNYHLVCDWVGSFSRITEHLTAACKFERQKCKNSECKEVLPKKFLKIHESKLCLWRHEPCPCCPKGVIEENGGNLILGRRSCSVIVITKRYDVIIIANHYHQCANWPVRCPNFCEPYRTLKQYAVSKHVEENCPETVVACKFAEVGCKVKVKRKDLPQHMQEAMMDHLTSLFTDHVKLKKELDHLKSQKK